MTADGKPKAGGKRYTQILTFDTDTDTEKICGALQEYLRKARQAEKEFSVQERQSLNDAIAAIDTKFPDLFNGKK